MVQMHCTIASSNTTKSDLNKIMNGLKVEEVVVGHVDADAEVEASVASVDDLVIAKFDKICVFGISN
jgi:hypothetical protein